MYLNNYSLYYSFNSRKEAFRSVYINLLIHSKEEPKRFYCIFDKYTLVVESKKENDNENIFAIVYPSSKALRWKLQSKNINFKLPFDKKNGIAYYDSLEPDQVGQLDREKYEQSSLTQLIIEGKDNIQQLMNIFIEKHEEDYLDLTFYTPRILSSFKFTHGSIEKLNVKSSGSLTRTIGSSTKTFYRIELEGDILPTNLKRICDCFESKIVSPNDVSENYEITLNTYERTRYFNLPLEKEKSSSQDSEYISKIDVSAQGSKYTLEYEK